MTQPAVNTLPPAVILLFLPIVVIEGYVAGAEANLWGSFDARVSLIRSFAFLPDGFRKVIDAGLWLPEVYWRALTYPFFHFSFMQSLFGAVFILAVGKFVGEVLGNLAVVIIFFASAILGALCFTYLVGSTFPLAGSFPAAYGLIGGLTFILFSRAEKMLAQQVMAFRLIGILMVLNIGFGLFEGGPPVWVAELIGAMVGFIVAALLRPQGVRNFLEKLRRS